MRGGIFFTETTRTTKLLERPHTKSNQTKGSTFLALRDL